MEKITPNMSFEIPPKTEHVSLSAFITGGTGVVGMALTQSLLQAGYSVCMLIREESGRRKQVEEAFREEITEGRLHFLYGDLANLAKWSSAPPAVCQRADIFFHLGWMGTTGGERADVTLQQKNIAYTLDSVRFAAVLGCRLWLGAGSQAEYGPKECPLCPDLQANPVTEYGKAKLRAGSESRTLCRTLHLQHVWCRILSVYGPYDGENTMVTSAVRQLLLGEYPKFTRGDQMWDYLYAEDAGDALRLAAEKGRDGAVYCVGSGTAKPLYTYIEAIRDGVNPTLPLGIGELPYPADSVGRVTYLKADIGNLSKDTGFFPKVDFKEGIRRTIEWNRKVLARTDENVVS